MNHIVRINGRAFDQLVFKSRSDAVSTAKRKIMLGVDNVTLSTGYPGVWDDAKSIKAYADTHWYNRADITPGDTSDHYCDKCTSPDHPDGQDQPSDTPVDIGADISQPPGW